MKAFPKILVCVSIILSFQFSILNSATAQITHASQGRLDENATAALQKAAKKLNNVKCTVSLTVLDSKKKEIARQSAEVQYSKGKYRLVMDNQEIISDGTTVWQWDKSAKEVAINNVSTSGIDLLNPGSLLANYNKNFRAKYIRTEDDGNVIVDMQPRSAQNYHKIRLFIDEESGRLNRLEVHKYDSGREIYTFSNYKFGGIGGKFQFDTKVHPDVEVIDMR